MSDRNPRTILALAVALVALQGCSLLSPPHRRTGQGDRRRGRQRHLHRPSSAKNTVYHEHKAMDAVCVEYNPLTPDPDIAPALQAELRNHEIDSRIYEQGGTPPSCRFRVTYTADIEWDTPPLGSGYKSYIRDATLTLRDENGTVLSSSAYSLDGTFQMGQVGHQPQQAGPRRHRARHWLRPLTP